MGSRISLWMLIVCTQILVITGVTDGNDVGALNAIKSSWQNVPPNWSGSDPCGSKWDGINCTNSRVTNLVLAGMGVKSDDIGDIPSLSQLIYLDLSNNKGIKAPLPPSIQNLKNLTTLILVGCSFFGPIPDTIGSLEKLIFLGLNNNSFTGIIPPSIGNLRSLSWLDVSGNKLEGPIPVSNGTAPGLDMLKNAKHFHLADNQLSGDIRSELFRSDMTLLHVIFNNNRLTGNIPSSIGLVSTLQAVRLDSNSLDGIVPQNITNLKSVSKLYLSNNKLSGPVPNLTGMVSLFYVDMSNNSFDASDIPTWFSELPSLTTLLMEKTQLQGEIPSTLFQPQLEKLLLSNNGLNGILDVGNTYNSDLNVDLTNNSILDFNQKSVYNMTLNLASNPVCEGGATGRYCATGKTNIQSRSPSNGCDHVRCGSDKVPSPNCTCAHPYIGTITFLLHSFSNLDNTTYYKLLNDSLMSAFRSKQLPVESIFISNAFIGEYLQYTLHIFPSGQDHFNLLEVSSIGTVINRQPAELIVLPRFGPFFFLDVNYFEGDKSSNHGAIIGVSVGSFVIVCLAISYAIYQKRRATRARQSDPFASWVMDNGSDAGGVPELKGARLCSFEELKRCTDNFSEEYVIGSGGYGKVYRGTLSTGHEVAIKRAKQGSLQGAQEFKTEIELLSRIHHKNVVALVGFCYEQGEQMLVYEYISNGTLKDNLSGKSGMRLNWMKRLTIALDSAKGLTYLHELANPPIIHRDIKSNNILVDDHLIAKVADFGLSKLLGDSKDYVSTQVKGTLGYMDPEYFMTQKLTEKSDVYSFGVVLLELLTARPPIHKGKYIVREVNEAIDKSPNELHKILDPYLGSSKTVGGLTKFVNLAMRCVQDLGVDRPKMGDVVREIEAIINLAVVNVDAESPSTFSTQNIGKVEDLYHPYSDSVSDSSSLYVFETELRR
ncbi:leucine-rich repeat receptor protein kinase HPCA1 [Lactuca sativa]|uniref:non-specific serine/threonine protein kinase n=1 Tax=Lactuca sativa TaxID=4236 RepID=A0A9R1UDP5_LACSA|nr:leucine-rich repeat receptor protein kinase HPCA1 [Lactuca sativa]KAJ0185317.1 hypothetical protein LSAT_V11C900489610 [Lactuca sativa]